MDQVSVTSPTASGRSVRRALRPLLVLGGFIALWWILMTGAAHAAPGDEPRTLGDVVRSATQVQPQKQPQKTQAPKAQPSKVQAPKAQPQKTRPASTEQRTPVRHLVRSTERDVVSQVQDATKLLRQSSTTTVRPVAKTVDVVISATPLAPAVTTAGTTTKTVTDPVTSTLSGTLASVQTLLSQTPLGPVVDPAVGTAVDMLPEQAPVLLAALPLSVADLGAPTLDAGEPSLVRTFDSSTADAGGRQSAAPARAADATPTTETGEPLGLPFGAPHDQDPCASASGSGHTPFTHSGTAESSMIVTPTVVHDHHQWRHARLPGGPAYEPGSSPD